MQIVSRTIRGCAVLGGLGLAWIAAPASADIPKENALSPNTLAVVRVADASDLRKAIRASQFGQMIADPAMETLKADVKARLQEFDEDMKKRVGMTLFELLEIPQGPAWLAVVRRDGEDPIGLLLAADAGENGDKMQEVMSRATDQLKEQQGTITTETFKDLTLHVIQPPDEKQPPLVWTNSGSTYVIGVGLDGVKELLANADGREDSLASTEAYQAVKAKVDATAEVTWYIDLGQIIKVATQTAAEQGGDANQAEAMIGLLGVNQLQAVGGSVKFGDGPLDTQSTTYVHAPGEKQGVLKLVQLPTAAMKPEPWVPDTVASYQTLSWDLDAAFIGLTDLVNMFLPGALENVERGLQGPGGETIRFQQDLFGPIGDRLTIISDFKKPITEQSQRSLVGIALEDTKGFQTTLNKILAISGANPKKRDFQGTTIYDFEMPDLPAQAGQQVQFNGPISVAIARDTFFATTDTSLLEQVLRPGSAALADSADFQAVAKQFPEKVSTFSFSRPDEGARLTYDLIKSGQYQQAISAANVAGGGQVRMPDLTKYIDGNKLPEFSVFAKYLADSGGYSVQTEDGIIMKQFTLKKGNP